MKNVLVLSPYDALSHCYWREGLAAAMPEWDITAVSLPPRHFSWRVRGNSLTLSQRPEFARPWDAVIATSMTDLSALRGLAPGIAACPNIVYFHENQFAYPPDRGEPAHRVERQITSIYTALAADHVVFNSDYNRRTCLEGARELLARMPDGVPAGTVERIARVSRVLPVPLTDDCFAADPAKHAGDAHIVWNHRWEFDKGPGDLLTIVDGLLAAEVRFVFHLVGQPFREVPAPIREALARLAAAGRLGSEGFLPRTEYLDVLARSHVVLSTAQHEFQGLAVLEAMASGCWPLVPNRLAYPEFVPQASLYADADDAIARLIAICQQVNEGVVPGPVDVSALRWPAQRADWLAMVE